MDPNNLSLSATDNRRRWLRHYLEGTPADIDVNEYASVVELFHKSVQQFAPLPAYSNLGTTLSYQAIEEKSRALAAFLQQELGLAKGERVAVMMPNLLQYPVSLFGILRAGLIVVNVNPFYTARELKHQLTDAGAAAIIILENQTPVLAEILADTPGRWVITTKISDLLTTPIGPTPPSATPRPIDQAIAFPDALVRGARHTLQTVALRHGDIAFLQYTGGTTGIAKGAMLTHGNIVANTLQCAAWYAPILEEGKELVVTALPLYHIFALTINCFTCLKFGGLNYLVTNPRDLNTLVQELSRIPFTWIIGVNTLFNGLLHTPGFAGLDFSRLKVVIGGGMAVQRAVAEQWREVTQTTLIEGYGLTETSPLACVNPPNLKAFNGSIGLPVPSTECSIQDEDGNHLPIGAAGELCIRGPQVMKGYWNRPDETAKVLSPDGWLRTGDIAQIDEEGFITLVDRKKDMVLVSGFNVYPNEVEGVVAAHPGVLEVAAVGVPDADSGETVAIVVVKKDPNLTEEELLRHCKENLTAYKLPKQIQFWKELPKTTVGKILRREIRERLLPASEQG